MEQIDINIENLRAGLPTLTPYDGSFFYEVALFCLNENGHSSGVIATRTEGNCPQLSISWNSVLDKRAEYTYRDHAEAAEFGATGLAILYSLELTGHNTVERSAKGTSFDYWIGDCKDEEDISLSRFERMEISGIFSSDNQEVKKRFKIKQKQISKSDAMKIPKIVFIFEFSNPLIAVERKDE